MAKRLLLLICCISLESSTCNQLLLPKAIETVTEISSFTRFVALNYCWNCNFIGIVSDQVNNRHDIKDRLLQLCHTRNKPIIITNNVTKFVEDSHRNVTSAHHIGMTQLLIIFVGNLDQDKFRTMIADVHIMQYFQSTTRVLFVFYKAVHETDTIWLQKLFKIVWDSWILRAIAVYWNAVSTEIEVVTFNPYKNDYYVNITDYYYLTDIFYDKTGNMYGCSLNALLRPDSERGHGYDKESKYKDVDMMTLLSVVEQMNATAGVYFVSRRNDGMNASYLADIDVRFISSGKSEHLALIDLYPHGQNDICVLVPKGDAIPQVLYLFMVFNIPVWVCFLALTIVGIMGYYFLNKKMGNQNMDKKVMNTIRVVLAGPWVGLPQSNPERFIINFLTLFGFLITSFFICGLTSAIIDRKYYPDVKTLKELENTDWNIYGSIKEVGIVHKNLNETFSKHFLKRFIAVNDSVLVDISGRNHKRLSRKVIYKVMVNIRRPLLMAKESAKHFLDSKDSFHDGRRTFSLMPECPVPYQVSYSVTRGRGSIYEGMLNFIIKRLHVSGIIMHWGHMAEIEEGHQPVEDQEDDNVETRILNLYHLQTPFYLLSVGLIAGCLAFAVEITTVKRIFRSKRKMKQGPHYERKLRRVYYIDNVAAIQKMIENI